ncbi:MAG: hypothetical protein ACUZ77_11785 [Candidatus Brocadiales bacterium]
MKKYPWYDVVDGNESLLQGDFIKKCPLINPPKDMAPDQIIEYIDYDVVIMSQSCDLAQRKLDLVLVCPVWPLSEFEKIDDFIKSRKGKEALRQGNVPGYHLLNMCDVSEFKTDYLIVDFRNVYGVPFEFIQDLAKERGKRLRLLPPYKEHLSQGFARFFMRVGLPVDIPSFG